MGNRLYLTVYCHGSTSNLPSTPPQSTSTRNPTSSLSAFARLHPQVHVPFIQAHANAQQRWNVTPRPGSKCKVWVHWSCTTLEATPEMDWIYRARHRLKWAAVEPVMRWGVQGWNWSSTRLGLTIAIASELRRNVRIRAALIPLQAPHCRFQAFIFGSSSSSSPQKRLRRDGSRTRLARIIHNPCRRLRVNRIRAFLVPYKLVVFLMSHLHQLLWLVSILKPRHTICVCADTVQARVYEHWPLYTSAHRSLPGRTPPKLERVFNVYVSICAHRSRAGDWSPPRVGRAERREDIRRFRCWCTDGPWPRW